LENQTRRTIRVLRTDNGGEYTSKEFNYLCAGEGIKRDLIVPYNPQKNGVAERKNMAIVGAVRAMLHDQGLPLFFWMRHVTLHFMCRTRVHTKYWGIRLLRRYFSRKNPKLGHFRIFGCLTYSHVPFEKRKKLEPMTEKGIFVGYSENSKALHIYISSLRTTILRRDVIFEEDRAFRKSRGTERGDNSSPHIQVSPQHTSVT
jgi:hypothetical protein